MPRTPYISRMVNVEPSDYRTVIKFVKQQGLGKRGFSAALRIIIRDWVNIFPLREPVDGETSIDPETDEPGPDDNHAADAEPQVAAPQTPEA